MCVLCVHVGVHVHKYVPVCVCATCVYMCVHTRECAPVCARVSACMCAHVLPCRCECRCVSMCAHVSFSFPVPASHWPRTMTRSLSPACGDRVCCRTWVTDPQRGGREGHSSLVDLTKQRLPAPASAAVRWAGRTAAVRRRRADLETRQAHLPSSRVRRTQASTCNTHVWLCTFFVTNILLPGSQRRAPHVTATAGVFPVRTGFKLKGLLGRIPNSAVQLHPWEEVRTPHRAAHPTCPTSSPGPRSGGAGETSWRDLGRQDWWPKGD